MEETQFASPVSDHLLSLFTSRQSVSSLLAEDPTIPPGDAWKKLYSHHVGKASSSRVIHDAGKGEDSKEALKRVEKCGNWGPTEPSELFLKMYQDAINSIENSPGHAMVSPPLMGSCGVLPLTIISTIPDIVRHMSNIIVRAEREVFLATNYWQNSVASKFITDAMKELDRRAGQRGIRVVFKVLYDRGSPKQLLEPHYNVSEKEYTGKAVALPHPHEIPHIDLEVMNYHQPMLGTFHAKFMVVDRKIAILQSDNIQDNDNLEMMVHMEGPIVDSMYDMALISWHKQLRPPLPSHNSPAAKGGLGSFGERHDAIFGPGGTIRGHSAVVDPRNSAQGEAYRYDKGRVEQPGAVGTGNGVQSHDHDRADVLTGPTTTTSVLHPAGAAADTLDHGNHNVPATRKVPDEPAGAESAHAYLHRGRQAIPQAQIQDPFPRDGPLPEHQADDPHYDDDIAGEVARVQTSVSDKPGETALQAVNRKLNHTTNKGFPSDAPIWKPEEEMTPYIPHPTHQPFPIAMVNRPPYGAPNHKSVVNPQNAAWLSAMRNAKKNVFIQSPTLNAEPLIPAIIEACERGIDIYCYICLGYNDAGELLPGQGGHNEMIAHKLYAALSPAGKQHLHYFWYVAKDQTRPIPQSRKKRDCHIKLMIVDEHVGVVGNGNQDTQSWFHSQEINVMLDSAEVCRAWIDGLRRNQNTHVYGALDKDDGVWRDGEGREAEGAMGVDPGRFSWAKGFVGAIKRVQGTGGF